MASHKPETRTQQPSMSRVASKGKTNKKVKKKKHPIVKAFIFIIIFALLAIIGFGIYVFTVGKGAIGDISIVDNRTEEGQKISIPVKESVKQKPVTLALLGIDQRKGGGGLNTDVLIVAALNPTTKKGAVIAMPRDTRITYEERTRKANGFYANYFTAAKKNGADEIGAMREAKDHMKKLLGQFYDIPVQYAFSVNFQGFRDVVDELGGIEVDVDMRMRWTDSHDGTDIDLQPGFQKLDGKQTLDFVRFRQSKENPNASSDFERNTRQTVVVKALLKKMISFGGITKIGNVIEEISEDVHTDMPSEEIERLLTTYYNIDPENITFKTITGAWKNPHVVPNEESLSEAKQLLQSIISE